MEPRLADGPLAPWGWDAGWQRAFESVRAGGLEPARVAAQHRGRSVVVAASGELPATTSGRFRYLADGSELPCVGDWVAVATAGEARIEAVLPRRSAFRRRAAGSRPMAQLVAANVDVLLIATSLNADLSDRRLERYVAMARESGAQPVVVLTKSDLADGPTDHLTGRLASRLSVHVLAVSARTGEGLGDLDSSLEPGRTIALVGSSGVGKSTLLNRLAGVELMATREIREDDGRGRHTTSHRQLLRLDNGLLMLDTPGMRELGLWDADEGVAETFAEIASLAAECRFGDCRHEREPGCAVQAAIGSGEVDERRLRSYRRLSREVADQPAPLRREAEKRFAKAVRHVAEDSMTRKSYRFDR